MGIQEQNELWAYIESLKTETQRVIYQLMMNKSISDTEVTHIEHVYLGRYAKVWEDVEAHKVNICYDKIFLIGGK